MQHKKESLTLIISLKEFDGLLVCVYKYVECFVVRAWVTGCCVCVLESIYPSAVVNNNTR